MSEVMTTSTMRPDFKRKLASFFKGCKRIHAEYQDACGFPNNAKWSMTWLKRHVRIEDGWRVFAFIDIETGEVLKTANAKTKHSNIFDEHNGLDHISPYGVSSVDNIKHGQF